MIAEFWKVMGICIVGTVLALVLKQKSGEYAFATVVVTGIIILFFVIKTVAEPIGLLFEKLSASGVKTEYFKIALKAVGVAYITDFIADASRDAGQSSIASKVELAGKAAIFLLSVPVLMSVLETAIGFIK